MPRFALGVAELTSRRCCVAGEIILEEMLQNSLGFASGLEEKVHADVEEAYGSTSLCLSTGDACSC